MRIAQPAWMSLRGDYHTSSGDYAINLIGDDASGDGFDDTHGFLPGAVTRRGQSIK